MAAKTSVGLIVRAGTVYRHDDVDYIVVIEQLTGTNTVKVRLVNIVNWILLGRHNGTVMSDGSINVLGLAGTVVAPSVAAYFTNPNGRKK